ncbi:MAG: glucose-6-phosphate dehydrogenase assembly protein OpcA [Jaaginema sp. PMC 1079.18]|nr:glucose-6-phosphate dehydrogenase assembly protein OpcA [Jaaginema sp. PMC 1080.18]MEC4852684.1 glucose-6-phosphate dehydrogenase assembly protein OpcA [Jaaginema sp. PMC 1079.18]MEC4868742.1 glucose-6-phosphate dehydrogenase assembly protein OpcA [Jaaginema sp. PMC 1078.18]
MTTTPLVSLQNPKDVSIEDIEAELSKIWQSSNLGEEGPAATRAATFSFLIYEPEGTQQLLAALNYYTGPVDGIDGPRTVSAVKAAQKAFDFEVTGKSSPEFLARLQSEYQQLRQEDKLTSENLTAALQYSPDLDGAGIADAIAVANPCRIITLCPTMGKDEGVTAQVSAYCPIQKRSSSTLVCCEYITLRGTAEALERIGGVIAELMIPELPKFVWWKATPSPNYGLFQRLMENGDSIIFDSSSFINPEMDLLSVGQLVQQDSPIADLNWRRIAPWQELTAEAFDPPERRSAIWEVDRVTLDYEKGNPAQAILYLGWLASRLKWKPIAYTYEGGDYDIRTVKFVSEQQQEIEAELAGIPTADWGEIPGDLISLKLSSTNLQADCCTVLCSETTGCMRMEAGGGAQACRINQVTSVSDQKTEELLSQQLQRWGREMLYEESMTVANTIMSLNQQN